MDKVLRYLVASILVALVVRLGVDLYLFDATLDGRNLIATVVFAIIFGLVFLLFNRIFRL